METYRVPVTGGSCCAGKPVSLNHLNKGEHHLADDIPIRNDDALLPMDFPDLKMTTVKGRSTRTQRIVSTLITTIVP